jgi:hypothetical protein
MRIIPVDPSIDPKIIAPDWHSAGNYTIRSVSPPCAANQAVTPNPVSESGQWFPTDKPLPTERLKLPAETLPVR